MTLPPNMDLIIAESRIPELSECHLALQTATCALSYERSSRSVDHIANQEQLRKLKCKILLLQDEQEQLNEQLANEEETNDDLQVRLENAEIRISELSATCNELEQDLRVRSRELEHTRVELAAMQTMSNESTKVLTEKLALAREVSLLRPEVDSLRTQVAANKDLLFEKLSLQRELTTVQVELDNAQRSARRAKAKAGAFDSEESEFENQIQDLQRQLREHKLAQREARNEIDDLKAELAVTRKEKKGVKRPPVDDGERQSFQQELAATQKALGKAERLVARNDNSAEVEALKEELAAARDELKASKNPAPKRVTIDDSDRVQEKVEELRREIAAEKREKTKLDKALGQERQAWEAQRSLLDDKLNQFRTKLRSTKEKLKATEEQLETATEEAKLSKTTAPRAANNPRKRGASQLEPEMMGTPGDGPPAKRGKRNGSLQHTMPGEKSMFSITPFLNKTVTSLDPDTPNGELAVLVEGREKVESIVIAEDSPLAAPAKKTVKKVAKAKPKPKPLAPAASSKQNAKQLKRKTQSIPSLEKVVEEPSEVEKAAEAEPTKTFNFTMPPMTAAENLISTAPKLKPTSLKPRKSLATFASFVDDPSEKRKKRKLITGLSKTLFDEDDEEKPASKVMPARGAFAGKVFGKKGIQKGPMMSGGDGFTFSPLKKERRALSSGKSFLMSSIADS